MNQPKFKFRLGLDLGTTSLGWCILRLENKEPVSIEKMGVRIFSDGREAKTKEPLAVTRRNARSSRRRRDRYLRRREKLINCFIQTGLFPKDEKERKELENLNPYELRAKGLNEKLSLYELGRALFHINQRRGFKSNRRADRKDKNESSMMKRAIAETKKQLEASGARTLGEFLCKKSSTEKLIHKPHALVRPSLRFKKDQSGYPLYPDRAMYEDEVNLLLATQSQKYKLLTDEVILKIKDIIFFQRGLKKPEVGCCSFENNEKRAALALPLVQQFRIHQEVNNLELWEGKLSAEQKSQIKKTLLTHEKLTFGAMRKLLGQDYRSVKFNFEDGKRKEFWGDETSVLLSDEKGFGQRWKTFSNNEQTKIVQQLIEIDKEDEMTLWLRTNYPFLSKEQIDYLMDVPLEDGYGKVSIKAIQKILPYLEQGHGYSEACKLAGYHHSDRRPEDLLKSLPYYGEILNRSVIGGSLDSKDKEFPEKYWGKITNPTVHIGLNQLRKLVNAVIETYGTPDEIVVELARDLKLSREDQLRINQEQAKNQKDNERINDQLTELGIKPDYENRMIYKVWESLAENPMHRCCVFTGKQISAQSLFEGEFEVEHLIPFSRSYNDSINNKVIAHRNANRLKGNKTPYEAFSHSPEAGGIKYDWSGMLDRANLMPRKRRAFERDLLEGDMIARQLADTQYFSKAARQYLECICNRVDNIPGRMTAMLRARWGLNSLLADDGIKNRADHRHHAIDAFVAACTSRTMLEKISRASESSTYRGKILKDMPLPFEKFERADIQLKVDSIIVSHKPDHGGAGLPQNKGKTSGGLHADTAYGFAGMTEEGQFKSVHRVEISSFAEKPDKAEQIRDIVIRQKLGLVIKGMSAKSSEIKSAIESFSKETGIKKVRIVEAGSSEAMVGVLKLGDRKKKEPIPYKYYAMSGNEYAEIYEIDKGKKAGSWDCEIIPTYYANQSNYIPKWRRDNPTAKKIMRLQIDDMVAYEEDGVRKICRVKKMTGGRVYLRSHSIAQEKADSASWAASPTQLKLKKGRKVSVDILGRIKDPGSLRDRKNS